MLTKNALIAGLAVMVLSSFSPTMSNSYPAISETDYFGVPLQNRECSKTRETRRNIDSIRKETENILKRQANLLKAPEICPKRKYEWLAIYPDSFKIDVLHLKKWRRMNGLCSHVISIKKINNKFGSINDYIRYLWNKQKGGLKYVCLVGGACIAGPPEDPEFDITPYNIIPIDIFNDGPANIGASIYTSDFEVGDVTVDGYPEISVGRIPAENSYDVACYVNKLLTYESSEPGAWENEVTYFIDAAYHNGCSGYLASRYAENLKGYLPAECNLHYMFANDSTYTDSSNFPPSGLTYCLTPLKAIDEFNEGRSLVLSFGNGGNAWNAAYWMIGHIHSNCPGYFSIDSLETNEIFPFFIGAASGLGDLVHQRTDVPRPLVKELMFDSERGII
ncbi:hypothetical protein J7M07_03095, partial [bacterium]|nr:hypothetical protein [bacterium]